MVERRRTMTYKGLTKQIDKDERRALRRTQGQWWSWSVDASFALSATQRGIELMIPVPGANGVPSGEADDKVEMYGIDAILGIQVGSNESTGGVVLGALFNCHYRKGQTKSDYAVSSLTHPEGVQLQGLARPRRYVPFVIMQPLSSDQGNYGSSLAMPLAAVVGKSFTLVEDENMAIILTLDNNTPVGTVINFGIVGRCRYIKPRAV